jgi:hypothetical protein
MALDQTSGIVDNLIQANYVPISIIVKYNISWHSSCITAIIRPNLLCEEKSIINSWYNSCINKGGCGRGLTSPHTSRGFLAVISKLKIIKKVY